MSEDLSSGGNVSLRSRRVSSRVNKRNGHPRSSLVSESTIHLIVQGRLAIILARGRLVVVARDRGRPGERLLSAISLLVWFVEVARWRLIDRCQKGNPCGVALICEGRPKRRWRKENHLMAEV